MSFLFGWTKYLPNILPYDASDDENAKQKSKSKSTEEEEEKYDSDSDHEDAGDPLGGSFETLEEEIAYLRKQNEKLQSKYKYHKSQHKQLRRNFKNTGVVEMKINGQMVKVKQPRLDIGLDELAGKVEARLPKFLQRKSSGNQENQGNDKEQIYVPAEGTTQGGVMEIQSVDWWDMVKYETADQALSTFHDAVNLQHEQTDALGGTFIVLRESDIVDAIACFVSQCILSIPECHNLDHEEMMQMISGTFSELKTKGPLGKMMDWSSFVYQTYGWTSTAYTVYVNAAMAKTVLSCLVSAAWVIGVL